jgi:hypothetical protein
MSEAEIRELLLMHVDQLDSAFEFWLTASFAVVIAIHMTRQALSHNIRILICMLYLSTSLVAILLTIGDVSQIVVFTQEIDPGGSLPGAISNFAALILRFVVYLVGTIAISIAIFRYHSWTKNPTK